MSLEDELELALDSENFVAAVLQAKPTAKQAVTSAKKPVISESVIVTRFVFALDEARFAYFISPTAQSRH